MLAIKFYFLNHLFRTIYDTIFTCDRTANIDLMPQSIEMRQLKISQLKQFWPLREPKS